MEGGEGGALPSSLNIPAASTFAGSASSAAGGRLAGGATTLALAANAAVDVVIDTAPAAGAAVPAAAE